MASATRPNPTRACPIPIRTIAVELGSPQRLAIATASLQPTYATSTPPPACADRDVCAVSLAGHEQWRGPQAPLQNPCRAVAVVVLQKLLDAGVPTVRQYPFTAEAQVHRDIASTFGRARPVTPTGPGTHGVR